MAAVLLSAALAESGAGPAQTGRWGEGGASIRVLSQALVTALGRLHSPSAEARAAGLEPWYELVAPGKPALGLQGRSFAAADRLGPLVCDLPPPTA